jgi:hypothetical protein
MRAEVVSGVDFGTTDAELVRSSAILRISNTSEHTGLLA